MSDKHRLQTAIEAHLTPDDAEAINALFSYQPVDKIDQDRMKVIRDVAKLLAQTIMINCPRCSDRTVAIRKVREAMMTANASIALQGRNLG